MAETDPTPDPRRGRRRLWITFGLLAASLVVAEIVVRVAAPSGRLLRVAQLEDALMGSERGEFMGLIQDDPDTFWRFAPDVVIPPGKGPFFGRVSNEQGLRENQPIATPKAASELRILFLGDSCTFGYLLDERHTFVAVTEKMLRERFPGRRIECINGGVPGYTAFQCWRRLETEGFDYEPDVVVMQFGWNEAIVWDGHTDPEHYAALKACRPPAILQRSRLCQLLWTWLRWPGTPTTKQARLVGPEFRRILDRIAESTKKRNVPLLMLVTGSRQNIRNPELTELQAAQMKFAKARTFGSGRDSAYVDGVTEFMRLVVEQKRPVNTLLFDEAHPTMAYSEILAKQLVAKLTPWIAGR